MWRGKEAAIGQVMQLAQAVQYDGDHPRPPCCVRHKCAANLLLKLIESAQTRCIENTRNLRQKFA